MLNRDSVKRLDDKSSSHAIRFVQYGNAPSPLEAQVLAHRLQQFADERTGCHG